MARHASIAITRRRSKRRTLPPRQSSEASARDYWCVAAALGRLVLKLLLFVSPLTGFSRAVHRTAQLGLPPARASLRSPANCQVPCAPQPTRSHDLRSLPPP